MALHDDVCWLDLNGWGGTDDSPQERGEECRRLRMASDGVVPYCAVHGSLAGDAVTADVVDSQ